MSRHAIVVMGAAGAGKSRIGSALASALGVAFVEGDAFHPPGNVAMMAAGIPLTDDTRRGWLLALAQQLHDARAQDEGIVLACSALKRRYRDLLRTGDDSLRFLFLHGDAAMLRDRLQHRTGHYMPASLIDSQLDALEPPADDEHAWTVDATEPPERVVSRIVGELRRSTPSAHA